MNWDRAPFAGRQRGGAEQSPAAPSPATGAHCAPGFSHTHRRPGSAPRPTGGQRGARWHIPRPTCSLEPSEEGGRGSVRDRGEAGRGWRLLASRPLLTHPPAARQRPAAHRGAAGRAVVHPRPTCSRPLGGGGGEEVGRGHDSSAGVLSKALQPPRRPLKGSGLWALGSGLWALGSGLLAHPPTARQQPAAHEGRRGARSHVGG
jgi:hypothetical protein